MSNSLRPHGHQAPASMGFSRQEYWNVLPFPSVGNALTQGSNPGLPHCRQTLYHLSHQGSLIAVLIDFLSLFSYLIVYDFVIPWTAACQAPLSFTISWSLLKFMFIESMILCLSLKIQLPLNESKNQWQVKTFWEFYIMCSIKNMV